jgi:hypothetical protein
MEKDLPDDGMADSGTTQELLPLRVGKGGTEMLSKRQNA